MKSPAYFRRSQNPYGHGRVVLAQLAPADSITLYPLRFVDVWARDEETARAIQSDHRRHRHRQHPEIRS